jgi:hypothetical protein
VHVIDPEFNFGLGQNMFWDLVYSGSSAPLKLYHSAAEAGPDESLLKRKDKWTSDFGTGCSNIWNCTVYGVSQSPPCEVLCVIEGTVYGFSAPELKGLRFNYNAASPYNVGFNPLTYPRPASNDWGNCAAGSISTSQAQFIRKWLRWNRPLTRLGDTQFTAYSSDRTLLGRYTNRFPQWAQAPKWQLDFDGDGKRDIAVYLPPNTPPNLNSTGLFHIRKSSNGTTLDISLGTDQDMPVPGNYDSDSITDVAVFTPGAGLVNAAFWQYCSSAAGNATCGTTPTLVGWGDRGDVPFPDANFDGDPATPEIAVYQRGTNQDCSNGGCLWKWKNIATGATGQVNWGIREDAPMLGLFDSDRKSDIVVYRPSTGRFHMLISILNWNTGSSVTADFGSYQAATPSTAIPMWGLFRVGTFCCNPTCTQTCPNEKRQAFGVYVPTRSNHKSWVINWNADGSLFEEIDWGESYDIPIAGMHDIDADNHSDLVLWRALSDTTGSARFWIKKTAGGNLPAVVANEAGRYAFITNDVTGDGKPELWTLEPNSMVWTYYTSESNYATAATPITWGWNMSTPL